MRSFFKSLSFLLVGVVPVALAQGPTNPALAARIFRLADSSAKVHAALLGPNQKTVQMISRESMQPLMDMEALVTRELRSIVDSLGWPGKSQVGDSAAKAVAKLLMTSRDLPLQERAAALMEKAVAAAEASPLSYAYLIDRVRVNGGRQQIYGTSMMMTQFGVVTVSPIADSAGVDARRRSVGLGPLADSVAAIRQPSLDLPGGVKVIKPPRQ